MASVGKVENKSNTICDKGWNAYIVENKLNRSELYIDLTAKGISEKDFGVYYEDSIDFVDKLLCCLKCGKILTELSAIRHFTFPNESHGYKQLKESNDSRVTPNTEEHNGRKCDNRNAIKNNTMKKGPEKIDNNSNKRSLIDGDIKDGKEEKDKSSKRPRVNGCINGIGENCNLGDTRSRTDDKTDSNIEAYKNAVLNFESLKYNFETTDLWCNSLQEKDSNVKKHEDTLEFKSSAAGNQSSMNGDDQSYVDYYDQSSMNGDDQSSVDYYDQSSMISDDQSSMISDDQSSMISDDQSSMNDVDQSFMNDVDQSSMNDVDQSFMIDDRSFMIDDRSFMIDDRSFMIDDRSSINDDDQSSMSDEDQSSMNYNDISSILDSAYKEPNCVPSYSPKLQSIGMVYSENAKPYNIDFSSHGYDYLRRALTEVVICTQQRQALDHLNPEQSSSSNFP